MLNRCIKTDAILVCYTFSGAVSKNPPHDWKFLSTTAFESRKKCWPTSQSINTLAWRLKMCGF